MLDDDFSLQLEGTFDVLRSGAVAAQGGPHLSTRQQFQRDKIVAAIEHKCAAGTTIAEAITDYVRDSAFTTLNRFVALKMLEARQLVQECITKGEQSSGYREFSGMAPGLALLPDSAGYRLYVESLFDEFSTEIKVLFDRRDAASVLWPKRQAFEELLTILNASDLSGVWGEDETIGWVYQFFNSGEERAKMRDESHIPRNSRELAVRNQFFTPRYVVQFLVDNTLGRIWLEMYGEKTRLNATYLAKFSDEPIVPRPLKDPRDLRILDPACGSGHFLLYSFDLLLEIYEEAWSIQEIAPRSNTTGRSLREDYPTLAELRRAAPKLIVEHNLHGIDIDPRCVQIAALALWLRAQRAWKDIAIPASDRPRIQRTHIVLAEPMPGDATLVEEFAERLDPPLLRSLFKKMVLESSMAGELGALLRIEHGIADELHRACEQFVKQRESAAFLPGLEPVVKQGHLDFSGIDDQRFFYEAETRIIEALRSFAETATGGKNVRHRLFAGDAGQGIALIDLLQTRFDVVLMNPPFGEPTPQAREYIAVEFPEGVNDIFAAFVLRFSAMLTAHGRLGAITSRSFFVGRDLRSFRKRLINAPLAPLQLVVDLGLGVLDAMVETAAYVLGTGSPDTVRFLNLRSAQKNSDSINAAFLEDAWNKISLDRFRALPQYQFLYDISDEDAGSLSSDRRIEPKLGRVTKGLSTGDDGRFVRLRWEVRPDPRGGDRWELFSKGGEYGWFGSDVHLLIKRHAQGSELAAHAERTHGNVALSRQSSAYYGLAAVTWSRRSQKGFSARRLRPGICFSDKSPVIIPEADQGRWIPALLAALATETYLALIYAQSKFGSYETGSIKTLPVPDEVLHPKVLDVMDRLFAAIDLIDARDETCQLFVGPPPIKWDPIPELYSTLIELEEALSECGLALSQSVAKQTIDIASLRVAQLMSPLGLISFALGVALGRWNEIRHTTPSLPGPLAALSLLSVAEFPLEVEPKTSPRESEWLSDDEGTTSDVLTAVRRAALPNSQNIAALDADLRESMRKELFAWHVTQYSKSARKAPVYWQLAIGSAQYSVWVYYHKLNKDSIFRLYNELVVPKLRHEESKLELLAVEFGASPSNSQRKTIADQKSFVDELRAFLDEVRSVAPVWSPHFDDGVVVNFSVLWRLVPQHKSWQKELKSTWEGICAGEYDWSHLAMHLWPERVIPKCAEDRSLAIAHGLEDLFWVESHSGKWSPRPTPVRPIDELVSERTSVAVKAALKRLMEASLPTGANVRTERSPA